MSYCSQAWCNPKCLDSREQEPLSLSTRSLWLALTPGDHYARVATASFPWPIIVEKEGIPPEKRERITCWKEVIKCSRGQYCFDANIDCFGAENWARRLTLKQEEVSRRSFLSPDQRPIYGTLHDASHPGKLESFQFLSYMQSPGTSGVDRSYYWPGL